MPGLRRLLEPIAKLNPADCEQLPFEPGLRPFERPSHLFEIWEEFLWHVDRLERFPSVVITPSVCGGAARLIRTRIPV
jgi:hypothetical protein